ncbi:SWF or SNF family helicase [Streptomyces sp. NHF165]|uniref:SWIM zinc finger family protein n=1 Tax=Streptomyces sp. NHF165 TaxID=2175864 RepID=UPI00132F09E5|nr:SWF or SNF family helicase [Streptomyces sp. NHF165]QHF95675.1 SWF or SNF family helicase [Streptomyces sp. NHF165]
MNSTEEAPRRVTDEERVFAPLPPARGRGFARTWWGRSWLDALEDSALDGAQLKLGRAYARRGAVGAVSVRPGRITAVVRDGDGSAHRADVLLRRLSDDEWERVLEMIADEAGHIAALLDHELPPRLVADAADGGLDLLPAIGDLEAECGCGAWDHCPHTAALSYQMARLLDEDPFALLLLRGRSERQLWEIVQERSAARAATAVPARGQGSGGGSGTPAGVDAVEAFALGAVLPPLPPPPVAVPGAEEPAVLDTGSAPPEEVDLDAVAFLASAATARARRLLADALADGHHTRPVPRPLTEAEDAVRLAARRPAPAVAARLAAVGGRGRQGLDVAVRAWELGGAAALEVLDGQPAPESAERAREELAEAWTGSENRPRLRASRSGWTVVEEDVQLRYGPDGLWWPFRRENGVWWPVGTAERDPAAALAVARAAGAAQGEGFPDVQGAV